MSAIKEVKSPIANAISEVGAAIGIVFTNRSALYRIGLIPFLLIFALSLYTYFNDGSQLAHFIGGKEKVTMMTIQAKEAGEVDYSELAWFFIDMLIYGLFALGCMRYFLQGEKGVVLTPQSAMPYVKYILTLLIWYILFVAISVAAFFALQGLMDVKSIDIIEKFASYQGIAGEGVASSIGALVGLLKIIAFMAIILMTSYLIGMLITCPMLLSLPAAAVDQGGFFSGYRHIKGCFFKFYKTMLMYVIFFIGLSVGAYVAIVLTAILVSSSVVFFVGKITSSREIQELIGHALNISVQFLIIASGFLIAAVNEAIYSRFFYNQVMKK